MQRDLVERARSGDADAFAELAGTTGDRCMRSPRGSSATATAPPTQRSRR